MSKLCPIPPNKPGYPSRTVALAVNRAPKGKEAHTWKCLFCKQWHIRFE